ncbi:MAG: glycosyltransferase [Alphaproteobacteria bacterium]|nr:glycosyltransferase [Alphaproteobacteria bacterium]
MRVAVVTPYFDEPVEWLRRGHESVLGQGVDATHFLVADGRPDATVASWDCQHIVLCRNHADWGNTPRMAGGLSAASQGFDAVAYLDADDWFLDGHLASLLALAERGEGELCTSRRLLHRIDGTAIGPCTRVDGTTTVDGSGMLLTRTAFAVLGVWCLVPPDVVRDAPQTVLGYLQLRRRSIATTGRATVASRQRSRQMNPQMPPSRWDGHLRDEPPRDPAAARRWWHTLTIADRTAYIRRMGAD